MERLWEGHLRDRCDKKYIWSLSQFQVQTPSNHRNFMNEGSVIHKKPLFDSNEGAHIPMWLRLWPPDNIRMGLVTSKNRWLRSLELWAPPIDFWGREGGGCRLSFIKILEGALMSSGLVNASICLEDGTCQFLRDWSSCTWDPSGPPLCTCVWLFTVSFTTFFIINC